MRIIVTEQQLEVITHHSDCNEVVLDWITGVRKKHGKKKVCVPDDMWELMEEHNQKPIEEKGYVEPELRDMILTLFQELYHFEKKRIQKMAVVGNHIRVKYDDR